MEVCTWQGLPATWYYDLGQFAREISAIWARHWLCVGRAEELLKRGEFRRADIGDQQIFITRNRHGALRAFHNTCRHRGSRLCGEATGRFRAGRIVCPYHGWAWSLDGELLTVPRLPEACEFDRADFPLYEVALREWGGFVFVNLSSAPGDDFDDLATQGASALDDWPLGRLAVAHREVHEVACNWKVFWENYLECYHCPGIHPELCRLVPLYGEGLTDPADLPTGHALRDAPLLKAGALTWSADGRTPLPDLPGLGPERLAAGMTFGDFPPGMFVIAHRDHARSVRVLPLSPERTQLTVEWLLEPETLSTGVDLERLVAFGHRVVTEDARICEVNQAGLRCRAHAHGMLLPIEREVAAFDDWVRRCVGEG